MIGLEIRTSKQGRLWPTGYYKGLIDTLTRGGAKDNPLDRYPELASVLVPLVHERGSRFYPARQTLLSRLDDTALGVIVVRRVQGGDEAVSLGPVSMPRTIGWRAIKCDFFGTIGDSKSEAQSKKNRRTLEVQAEPSLEPHTNSVSMSFQLSGERRDRDLDNLVDPLIPFFSAHIQPLDFVCAVKEAPQPDGNEILRISQDPLSLKMENAI